MTEPLKITAWLQCGVVSDTTLPIDGVLYYQHMRLHCGEQIVTVPGAIMPHADVPGMRIRKHNQQQKDWYYAASFAQWQYPADGTDYWSKRFDQQHADLVDFGNRKGRVVVESGEYKAYRMPVAYRHALSVSWYVVADRAWAETLLRLTTHIGKKADQGWGAVLRWQVESWHADWSVYDDDGRLMRAIPMPGGVLSGIRPSYWLRRNQVPCQMPAQTKHNSTQ